MKEAHFIWNEEWAFTVDFTPPIKCRSNSCTDVATGLSHTIQTTMMYLRAFSQNDIFKIILFGKFAKYTCFADDIRCALIETRTTMPGLFVVTIFVPVLQ